QPGMPRDLGTICLKCLHKEPARRYGGALALADDLRRFLDGQPVQARAVGPVERGWRWARRNPAVAALVTSMFVLLTVIAVGGVTLALRANRGWKQAEEEK